MPRPRVRERTSVTTEQGAWVAPWRGSRPEFPAVSRIVAERPVPQQIHSTRSRVLQTERSGPGADISGEDHHNTQAQLPQTFADRLASAAGACRARSANLMAARTT